MSPKVIAILVVILLVIFGGMALTMKKATDKRRDRTGMLAPENRGQATVSESFEPSAMFTARS